MADAATPAASTKTNYTADVKDLKPPDWKNANIYDKPAMMRHYLPWRTSVIHLLITIDNLFDFAAKAGVSDKYDDPHKVVLKPYGEERLGPVTGLTMPPGHTIPVARWRIYLIIRAKLPPDHKWVKDLIAIFNNPDTPILQFFKSKDAFYLTYSREEQNDATNFLQQFRWKQHMPLATFVEDFYQLLDNDVRINERREFSPNQTVDQFLICFATDKGSLVADGMEFFSDKIEAFVNKCDILITEGTEADVTKSMVDKFIMSLIMLENKWRANPRNPLPPLPTVRFHDTNVDQFGYKHGSQQTDPPPKWDPVPKKSLVPKQPDKVPAKAPPTRGTGRVPAATPTKAATPGYDAETIHGFPRVEFVKKVF